MIDRPFSCWPTWGRSVFACFLCSISIAFACAVFVQKKVQTQRLQEAVGQAQAQLPASDALKVHSPWSPNYISPAQWPARAEIDQVVQYANDAAKADGVTLRTLSVSHADESVQAWGRVSLDVPTSGSYAAFKGWQAAMQDRFPVLSMQSLRIQPTPSGFGGALEVQAIWVLPVRGDQAVAPEVTPALEASPLRTALTPASRDPFLIYVAPPPAPPPVVLSPVVVAPIVHREPAPSLSFAGRMHTHDGRVVVLARWADGTAVRLEQGKEVGNGFRVERMTEQSVELLNPRTQSMIQLSLPAAPRFETR